MKDINAKKIPIVIIRKRDNSELELKLKNILTFDIFFSLTPKEIFRIDDLQKNTFCIFDASGLTPDYVITQSLFIRNKGYQVLISRMDDVSDLIEIINELYEKIYLENNGVSFRPEILITENTLKDFGDITPIIKKFEEKYLSGSQ